MSLSDSHRLEDYGWTDFFASHHAPYARDGFGAARVVESQRDLYQLITAGGERPGVLAGRLRHHAEGSDDLPAVGDWVATVPGTADGDADDGTAVIHAVLPRRSKLSRKVAGSRTREQLVAANVDTVFLVMGLDGDYNPRRLERFLTVAWSSGARPVVVLNKADLVFDLDRRRLEIEGVAPGVDVLALSCATGAGLDTVRAHVQAGETIALVGSSGAGKSTLINRLAGTELLRTGAVRADDDRGRHTTTHRQLVRLPGGGLLIDNPGVREIQLWGDEGLGATFDDIERLAAECRFGDCTHTGEPGCAVLEAVDEGVLSPQRLESWRGLSRELRYLERRQDEASRRFEDRKLGKLYKSVQAAKKKARRRF